MVRDFEWLHQWKFPCTASTGVAGGQPPKGTRAGGGALRAEVTRTKSFGEVQTDAESI